ncbi:PorP/SprF family type IX secretion system membrane protein [Aureibacter tunicatorum]|uniref:Type IX secretion system PorP/SprF family membrane protein n=1 Tax=Aureibacter tunicatorum TaxID=866807 RepID=A0AAE4BSC0_9BACT|nr:PorP/SprF family type IX secretion system membrane protein [Aureibacter tunicatorum]MDR6238693.1 type IX secretion system PorP/SprF family membrane protein [Aureibacter tunicatorum]BDD05376.1 hypothetical protein AUTU_28590 [Aureibacter tunicatorum]
MRKLLLILLLLWGANRVALAQYSPNYNQYLQQRFLFNPALAGYEGYSTVMLLYRNQWVGVQDGPISYTATFDSPLGKNMAIGAKVVREEESILNTYSGEIDFVYIVRISNTNRIRFGLGAGISQNQIDQDYEDPALSNTQNMNIIGRFGMFYENKYFQAGVILPQLLQNNPFSQESLNPIEFDPLQTVGISVESRINLNPYHAITPYGLYYHNQNTEDQYEAGISYQFKQIFSIGGAYRQNEGINGFTEVQVKERIAVGFAYGVPQSNSPINNHPTYSAHLKIRIGKRKNLPIAETKGVELDESLEEDNELAEATEEANENEESNTEQEATLANNTDNINAIELSGGHYVVSKASKNPSIAQKQADLLLGKGYSEAGWGYWSETGMYYTYLLRFDNESKAHTMIQGLSDSDEKEVKGIWYLYIPMEEIVYDPDRELEKLQDQTIAENTGDTETIDNFNEEPKFTPENDIAYDDIIDNHSSGEYLPDGNYVVVGTYKNENYARRHVDELKHAGENASYGDTPNKDYQYVFISSHDTPDKAYAKLKKVHKKGDYPGAWVLTVNPSTTKTYVAYREAPTEDSADFNDGNYSPLESKHYMIAGVFSALGNAQRMAAKFQSEFPNANVGQNPSNGLFYVFLTSSDDQNEILETIEDYKSQSGNEDLWYYFHK